jgi:Secretion system C-terminal sorting domain
MKYRILTIILLTITHYSFAQTNFKITSGNVKVNSTTSIVLKNTQFINNGSFDAATGTVHITGDATDAQSAIGGSSTTTFYNLKINKTSNGTQLNQLIQVDNELQMTSGNLDLNNNDLLLGNSNSAIMSESSTSYIHGSTGGEVITTVSLNAPTGENPGNIGVAITSAANLGSTTIYRGHVVQDVNGETSIERYYDIVPTNNSGLDATIQFYYFDHELNGIPEADLAPFEYDGVDWTEYVANDANQTTNFVEAIGIDVFYFWTLAELVAPLPIELLYFRGKLQVNNQILLDWVTSSEQNNKGFEVQRIDKNGDWQIIAWVNGFGTTLEEQRYDLLDKNPFAGLNYYRLKQVDFDGTFEYSEVIAIEVESRFNELEIFPNPTSGNLNFSESLNGNLIVRNVLGQVVWQKIETNNIQSLDLSFLTTGTYFLEHLDQNDNLQTAKFIISKN